MKLSAIFILSPNKISLTREDVDETPCGNPDKSGDNLTGGNNCLTRKEVDMNSEANVSLDEVTLQSKVMDDDQSLINIEDTADTNIPASTDKISNEHSSENEKVRNYSVDCKIDTLEEASQLIGDCPVTPVLKPLSETEHSEQEVKYQSETTTCLENANCVSLSDVTEGHHYSDTLEQNVTEQRDPCDTRDMPGEGQISENESRQNVPLLEIECMEENKTMETINLEDNHQENSQNEVTSQTQITISETGHEKEGDIINKLVPDDDNEKLDESKTFDMNSKSDSSFMFKRPEEKIPDIFSIQDDDKQEIESVKKESELIEVNNDEVTP